MPNLVAAPQFAKRTAVIAKPEAAYGVDAIPTGLLNWMEARDLQHTPCDDETVDRNIEQPHMGNGGKRITASWSKASFWVALGGGGDAGVAPLWAPLALAGALAETVEAVTSVTYNVVSDAFGSMTLYVYVGREWQKLIGARCELKGSWTAKGLYKLMVEATSLYTAPTQADMPAVERAGWPIEDAVNALNTGPVTINGTALAASAFDWSMGNQIQRVSLPGPQREVMIDERKPSSSVTVLAVPLATFNPYALRDAETPIVLSNLHGTVAGRKVTTGIKGVIIGVERATINAMAAWKLNIEPRAVDGNDEITLTLS